MDTSLKKILLQYFPNYKNILTFENILYEHFGKDNVEFGCEKSFLHITIKFLKIEIKNNTDKHILKDIYVRIILKKNGIVLAGTRGEVTIFEYLSEYAHSHLPRGSFAKFRDFCLGSGDFNFIKLNMLQNANSFTHFCLALPSFLAWESIEGVPYVRMRTVKAKELSYKNIPQTVETLGLDEESLFDNLKYNLENIVLNDLQGKITIVQNEKYISTLKDYFIKNCNHQHLRTFFGLEINEDFYSLKDIGNSFFMSANQTNPTNTDTFSFKGKNISLKIIYPDENETKTDIPLEDCKISPIVLNYLTKKIENKLQKSYERLKFREYKKLCTTT